MRIDLNCDLGEGAADEEVIMPLITSANIACGAHAGDAAVMRRSVDLAIRHRVVIGAHPGFADRAHFGRRELRLPRGELIALVREQVEALVALTPIRYVKPHGGLYTLSARDDATADAIAEAVARVDDSLALVGASGSESLRAARRWGLRAVSEVFADRRYDRAGLLVPRTEPDAVLEDVEEVIAQVLLMLREKQVTTRDGTRAPVEAETLCLHGDGAHALTFARRLREELADNGVRVAPWG